MIDPWYISAYFLKYLINLFFWQKEGDREREQVGGAAEGDGESGFLLSREPDTELNLKTPGSQPEPRADA